MREYSIKRGHDPDLNALVKQYFGADGNITNGFEFQAEGIGTVSIKREGNTLKIETTPSHATQATYDTLRAWNDFLFDATGRTAKERKKFWEKEVK